MYAVTCGIDVFFVETFEEVREIFEDYLMAIGAEDAVMSVRMVSQE